jgi:hypothetical protein
LQNIPRAIGVVQLALAVAAALIATGWFSIPGELLAAIIAAQNALTGSARIRTPSNGHEQADRSEPPNN